MLRAEKAALNGVQSSEGVAFSAKKKYNKKTTYDEYTTLVMQWSRSASTQPGDIKIFNNKGKDFRLLKATDDGICIEMARGSFKKVESIYAEVRREINENRTAVREDISGYRTERGRNSRDIGVDKNRKTDGQNRGQNRGSGRNADEQRSNEYNRQSVSRGTVNQTQSQQFKRWFGDWQSNPESSSKIVNADGTPKVMYHGTPAQFTVFDKKKAKSSGFYGKGFYFTDSESHSNQYGNSMAVYLNIKNPLAPGENALSKTQLKKFLEAVAENEDDYDIWNYGTENIDELAKVSTRGNKVVPDTKNHPFAKDGFNYRTAYFMDNDGQYYQITLSVGKNGAVNTIYNVGKLKKEAKYSLSGSKAVTDNSATMRSASNDNISDSAENVNGNISYSAKKPEIISGLQADYGYSEASANNIYRAARTLKQNTGSKADIEQLTSAIVTSLENRRNGDIDSKNIERIAMMLAENAQAVNETYVSEYQPIMDYLKGTKTSFSETDISDLGDAFSYVKKRLFPTALQPFVHLTKNNT